MPKYRVHLVQTVLESITVEVEAPNEQAAEASAFAKSLDLSWRFDDVQDREVISVEECTVQS